MSKMAQDIYGLLVHLSRKLKLRERKDIGREGRKQEIYRVLSCVKVIIARVINNCYITSESM